MTAMQNNLMQWAAYGLGTDRMTPHRFNLCRSAGSTHSSISQTQPLDMMLSTCTQLLWSTMARPVLSGTCPVKPPYCLGQRAAAQFQGLGNLLIAYARGSQTRSWSLPNTAHFAWLLCLTQPFHVLELLLMSWWVESGVIDKGYMQNVQCWGGSRNEFGNPWPMPSLCRATIIFFRSSESSLPWGAMLNFQWPVWESESDNTKFNTPVTHSHLRPCNTNESHDTRERKWLIGPNLDIFT